ncbi:class F sortase [Kocuria rosea]|uniref:class F sortase n=1 Tax=Kocuria rosea TaxID=1275 RepID=UPI002541BEE3|nr:class F sortase [Kocuria rosea]WIG18219.1 sortase [Kocuria rosea]
MDAPEQQTAPRRRAGTRWAAVGGLGAVAALSAVLLTDPWGTEGTGSPAATATAPVEAVSAAPPTAAPTGTPSAAATSDRPAAAAPVRLTVEDARFDVTVLPLTPSEQELATELLVPPDTLDGYWLTPYGMPGEGSENTTYITGHSWEDRDAPFNRLSDPGLVGSEIELETGSGTLEYVVDSVVTHDKNTLKDSDIWRIVPDRLVIVSCYTEDLWGKNVVLTASPAPA